MRLEDVARLRAASEPNATALIDAGGRCCSYQELQLLADCIADWLRNSGVRLGDRVGICCNKHVASVAAILGILQTRAAYVPVDAHAAPSRNSTIFADCSVKAVLVDPIKSDELVQALASDAYYVDRAGSLAGLDLLVANRNGSRGDGNMAYILYTSGSTGSPKGVCHTHASALAFIDWCSQEFLLTKDDRLSSHAPFHFDLSIFDLFVTMKHGAAVRLLDRDEVIHPKFVAQIIADERLTIWYSTPTALRSMVEFGDLSSFDHSALRLVCFAGERFTVEQLNALAAHWPQASFYNLYGPTETNVCTYFRVKVPFDQHNQVPIGFACSGNQLRTMLRYGGSSDGDECELLVSGDSVMEGYWNSPEATSEAFAMIDGLQWYRTGDLVTARDDGALVYKGRLDRMIKRRGYRIELGEVEAALLRHPLVSQAAAVAMPDGRGDQRIVAFQVRSCDYALLFSDMKRHCNRLLPSYMSPDLFYFLPQLPYTATGKTDYIRLEEIANELCAEP